MKSNGNYFLYFGFRTCNNEYSKHSDRPLTTYWGVFISIVSITIMRVLVIWKRNVGNHLNSAPILADANCTMGCVYMSIILLVSSGIYELFEISFIDSIGTLGLSYFAFKEEKNALKKPIVIKIAVVTD
ncbi:cation transporter [Echinicola shivajiensis]|uniref:cation transporter n=1 Tax=Echinicola shivajiensis TaxID=1035916 RepID=UPI00293D2A05|nr:cation transporter [Echinicola shivajiensis]